MRFIIWLVALLNLFTMGIAQEEGIDCRDKVTVPQLWRRYHSQVGDSVPKIHATVTSEDPDCVVSSYQITPATPGLILEDGGAVIIDTDSPIELTIIQITAQVGSQTILIANFTLEIYDCLPGVQFVGLESSYRAQQKGVLPKINMKATLGKVDEDCKISYYKIVDQKDYMNVDEYEGELTVDTTEALKDSVKVQVVIGSQVYSPRAFTLEIFDCNDEISFPDLLSSYAFQIRQQVEALQLKAEQKYSEECAVDSYALEGETRGTTIDPKTGVLSVDTTQLISPASRRISVQVGSQKVTSSDFSFEVFDCTKYLQYSEGATVQVGSTTKIIPALQSISRIECKANSFEFVKEVEGISIDPDNGVITVNTGKALPQSVLKIQTVIGSQKVQLPKMTFEVYDCMKDLTFTGPLVSQRGQQVQKYFSVNTNQPREECTDYSYSLNGSPIGVQMDENTGEIAVQTSTAIKKTSVQVTVQVGSQIQLSPSFDIEVYDCKSGLVHAADLKVQVGSVSPQQDSIQLFDALSSKPQHPNCQSIQYSVKGLKNGITLSEDGIFKVDTTNEMPESIIEVKMVIGSQTFENQLKFEVFDCLSQIEFRESWQVQLGSQRTQVSTVLKQKRKEDCAIQSFSADEPPPFGVQLDRNGALIVPTDQANEGQINIKANVGTQIASYSVALKVFTCESAIKFSDGLKVQKDTGIQKFSALQNNQEQAEDTSGVNNQACSMASFSLTEAPNGVSIDPKNGDVSVDTSKSLAKALLNVQATIGSQIFESEALQIEVFDCNDYVSLPIIKDTIKFQKDQKVDPLDFAATVSKADCKVNEYRLIGEVGGATLDSATGQLEVNTSLSSQPTALYLQLAVGSQVIQSRSIEFEIFDCLSDVKFPNLKTIYNFQKKLGDKQEVDANPVFTRSDCSVSSYIFPELPEGIEMIPNSGKFTIDTSSSIKKSQYQLTAKIGSQSLISPEFSIEVFDCAEIIKFIQSQKIQLDEPTRIMSVVEDNSNVEQCGGVKYSVEGLVPGISMDLDKGEITVATSRAIQNTALKVTAEVGQQKFQSPAIEFEVFDCRSFVTQPFTLVKYKYQMNSEIPKIELAFTSTFPNCIIGYYSLSKSYEGITLDPDSATLTISNQKEIKTTELQLSAKVGTQTLKTQSFSVEVFDCNKYLSFVQDKDFQIDDAQNQVFPALATNDNPSDCVVTSFEAADLKEGVNIDQESGKITLVTTKAIEKTDIRIQAVVGTQTILAPKFSIEVYDCAQAIVFAESPRFQLNQQKRSFDVLASNSRPSQCGEYTMALVDNTSPAVTKGQNRAQIVVDTSQELPKTSIQILLKVGVQELTNNFDGLEVYDCRKFVELPKMEKMYRYQINQKIPNIFGSLTSSSEDCVISSYSLTKSISAVKVDSSSGKLQISNKRAVQKTEFEISAQVGSQIIKTESFSIEVYDCTLEIVRPHLWVDHHSQAIETGFQLKKVLIIDARPQTKTTDDCPISRYNISGSAPGIKIIGDKGLVEVDKDQMTDKVLLKTVVYIGSQVIEIPDITLLPRSDQPSINIFALVNASLLLIIILACCIYCCCCRTKKKEDSSAKYEQKDEEDDEGGKIEVVQVLQEDPSNEDSEANDKLQKNFEPSVEEDDVLSVPGEDTRRSGRRIRSWRKHIIQKSRDSQASQDAAGSRVSGNSPSIA